MVEFYLLTFSRFPLRKKEHKSYFGKNRTHDFRNGRCADYPLDHSGKLLELFNKEKSERIFGASHHAKRLGGNMGFVHGYTETFIGANTLVLM